MKGFFLHHPDLSLRLGQQQDTKRLMSKEVLERYADMIGIVCVGVKGENTYTMDETELGSAEYRKQLAAKQLAAGMAVDGSALPSLKLTAGEKARIIEDVAKLNLQPLLPRVPMAAVKAAAGVERKMKAGLLTGTDHLITLAAKMEEKEKEVADKAARKVARAAAKAAKAAAKAAKEAAKAVKRGGGAAGAGAAAGGPVPAAAFSAGVGGAPVRKKRAGAGESAVDGARQYTKRQRQQ